MDASLPPRTLRILQISDPHLFAQTDQTLLNVDTNASLTGVINHIRKNAHTTIDAIVATGDIAQDGSAQACSRFLDMTRELAPVVCGLPGNHDENNAFYTAWGDRAHAVTDLDAWRLILMDSTITGSNAGHIAADQFELLHQAASSAEGRNILVAIHHNPVPVGSRWLDSMMIDNGHKLLDMLQGFPAVRGLIWGHVHQEFDSVYNFSADHQLRLLATPSTCVQFTPRSTSFSLDTVDPGYRWLELHSDGRIETDVVRVSGLGIHPDTGSGGY